MATQLNPLALIVLAYTSATIAPTYFGLDDPARAAMFVLAWTLPVPRLIFRERGANGVLPIEVDSRVARSRRLTFVVVGVLPWLALPWLFRTFPDAILWQSWPIPAAARWLGAALIFGVVLMPASWSFGSGRRCAWGRPISALDAAAAASIVLVTGNPFLVLVSVGGLIALWWASRPAPANRDVATEERGIAQPQIATVASA